MVYNIIKLTYRPRPITKEKIMKIRKSRDLHKYNRYNNEVEPYDIIINLLLLFIIIFFFIEND